jgi:hypothetical protein
MEAGTLGNRSAERESAQRNGPSGGLRRLATETKASIKSSEFWLVLATIAAILISAAVIKAGESGGADVPDEFLARQAWLYVAIVVGAYAIGRGLAKSGSREPYTTDGEGSDRGNSGR